MTEEEAVESEDAWHTCANYVHDELRELRERLAMERALVQLAANEIEWDDDELMPVADANPSPTCPQCGAPLDEHNSRGECPPY